MTNATVAQEVDANDGKSLSVKYKDGEKKVVVSPDTLIVNFVDGAKSELTAGAKITTAQANLLASAIAKQAAVLAYIDGLSPQRPAPSFACCSLRSCRPTAEYGRRYSTAATRPSQQRKSMWPNDEPPIPAINRARRAQSDFRASRSKSICRPP